MSNNIKEQVMSNPLLKQLIEEIKDPKEKEKTLRIMEGMLEQLQGKVSGLTKAYEDISKK